MLSRRRLLWSLAVLSAARLLPGLSLPVRAESLSRLELRPVERLGLSQFHKPLELFRVGLDPAALEVLVMGGVHGWPERNGSALCEELLAYFEQRPQAIPAGVRLAFYPWANPDGLASGSRFLGSGVDMNRNWPAQGWQPDIYDGNGALVPGGGGAEPLSEPEAGHLADYILLHRPAVVVDYHSRGGVVLGGQYGAIYAQASGYPRPRPGVRVFGYSITGSMGVWLRSEGLEGVLVELSNYSEMEFRANLAGLRAVLQAVVEVDLSA